MIAKLCPTLVNVASMGGCETTRGLHEPDEPLQRHSHFDEPSRASSLFPQMTQAAVAVGTPRKGSCRARNRLCRRQPLEPFPSHPGVRQQAPSCGAVVDPLFEHLGACMIDVPQSFDIQLQPSGRRYPVEKSQRQLGSATKVAVPSSTSSRFSPSCV